MKIKIIRSTMIDGKSADPGAVLDLSENDAQVLIGMKKAIRFEDPAPLPAPKVETATLPPAETAVLHRSRKKKE